MFVKCKFYKYKFFFFYLLWMIVEVTPSDSLGIRLYKFTICILIDNKLEICTSTFGSDLTVFIFLDHFHAITRIEYRFKIILDWRWITYYLLSREQCQRIVGFCDARKVFKKIVFMRYFSHIKNQSCLLYQNLVLFTDISTTKISL